MKQLKIIEALRYENPRKQRADDSHIITKILKNTFFDTEKVDFQFKPHRCNPHRKKQQKK